MQELLNIRFSYLCRRTRENEAGKSPIVLRVIFRGERRDIFTGLYCFKGNWDRENIKVRKDENKATSINENLELIVRKATHAFDELKFSGNSFTIGDLVDKIKGKENRPALLIDFLEEGNSKMLKRVGTEILKITYLKYRTTLAYMKDFLQAEFRVKNFNLQRVNIEFMQGFFQFLLIEKKVAHNTACKYLGCVKTILSPAIRIGLIKPDPFYGFRMTPKPVFKDVLTQEEIDKIAI